MYIEMPASTSDRQRTRKNQKAGNCEKSATKNCHRGTRRNKKYGGSAKDSPKSVDDVCSICLLVIGDDKFKTKCNHIFHSKCIGMWCNVRSGVAKVCPYCRRVIDEDCKDLLDVDSIGIMPYLKRRFYHTTHYGRADVDKEIADNDAVIQKYLDAPRFDPNVVDADSNTPLHIAVEQRRLSVVKNLLARKEINTDIRNNRGKLAIEIAMDMNYRDALTAFKKYKKIPKALKGLF